MRVFLAALGLFVIGCMGALPRDAVAGEEAKPAAAPTGPTASYDGTVSLTRSKEPAVRVRFQLGEDLQGKATVQYLPTDKKQAAKFTALDLPAEATFACAPPKGAKKNEYRLVFSVPLNDTTVMLYGRLEVFRATEFTQNSVVKIEITEQIVKAVSSSGDVQIVTVRDPHLSTAGALANSAGGKGKKDPGKIEGVGDADIAKLTLGNRAFGI